ncbi:hypothetical protein Tco_1569919 [Tanacetum coccineum]
MRTTLTNKFFCQKVNTAKGKVNTARPNTAVVNAVRANQGHPQKEDQGYVESGCLRHMIGNMSYLSDFKEFDGRYVTFGGGAKGGRITGKGTLKTAVMSSASSAVTYTSVYTDSEPGRVFWGADEEISDGGSPRVIVYGYNELPMQPVALPSPDYIPDPGEPQTPPVP